MGSSRTVRARSAPDAYRACCNSRPENEREADSQRHCIPTWRDSDVTVVRMEVDAGLDLSQAIVQTAAMRLA
jgi:hypothetical protein